MIARVGVVVAALAVLGWLGVMERGTRQLARGEAALRPGASAAELGRAEVDLRRAGRLTPDAQPEISLALVRRARGDVRGASATVERVVRREPDNLLAWGVLAVLSRGRDRAALARATAARRRLDPVNARRARRARP